MVLGKREIVDIISEKTDMLKKDIYEVIDALAETVYEELKKDNTIVLRKLFRIEPIIMNERQRYNPNTGELDDVEEHKSVKISVSKTLKEIIRDAPSETQIKDDLERLTLARKMAALQAEMARLDAKMNNGR